LDSQYFVAVLLISCGTNGVSSDRELNRPSENLRKCYKKVEEMIKGSAENVDKVFNRFDKKIAGLARKPSKMTTRS